MSNFSLMAPLALAGGPVVTVEKTDKLGEQSRNQNVQLIVKFRARNHERVEDIEAKRKERGRGGLNHFGKSQLRNTGLHSTACKGMGKASPGNNRPGFHNSKETPTKRLKESKLTPFVEEGRGRLMRGHVMQADRVKEREKELPRSGAWEGCAQSRKRVMS